MQLYIASGTHVDRDLSNRIENIQSNIGQPDIVFAEGDSPALGHQQLKGLATAFLISPLIGLAAFVQIYILVEGIGRVVSRITDDQTGKDTDVVDEITSKYGISSKEVDSGPSGHLISQWILWEIVTWVAILIVTYFHWPADLSITEILWYFLYLLLAGYVLLMVLLALTLNRRDEHMANTIAEMVDTVDTACLITGEAHHPGIAERLEDTQGVEVINPTPTDPGLTTRLFLAFQRGIRRLF